MNIDGVFFCQRILDKLECKLIVREGEFVVVDTGVLREAFQGLFIFLVKK